MDLVNLEDTVTGSYVSRQCVENLHNNMEIEESMRRQKHCEPIKNLPAVTICDRKCCSFVNRELQFIKICPERGRYRVGPFLMPRPFGIKEERLINFCMDDDLKKGEMLFQTNFNGITRNDIMSLSPRSIINMKVVSAVSELLSAQTTVNVGQSKFNLFLPPYNTLQDHVGGEYRDASVAVGKFIPFDLYAKNIHSWEKEKVRSSAEMHQRRIDVAEHNAGEAIQKRRLHQLSFKNKRGKMKGKIARELFPDRKESYEECMGEGPTRIVRDAVHWSKGWLTDDEEEQLQDKNDDGDQLEGYSSEIDKGSLYKLRDAETSEDVGDWLKFDDTSRHKMVLYQGQRFRDVGEFRKAVQVFAVREGFKLCVMENRSHVVCYECSDLRCDWVIQAGRVSDGTTFIVTDFMPQHTCIRPPLKFQPQSKWISAIYLHRWKLQPKVSTVEIRDEIETTYGVVCPEGKLLSAANRAKHILGMDHFDGYARLNQLKKEMERIDSHNIVLLETDGDENGEGKRLNKMFVCWERTSYAFKYHCRGILAVDGWKMNNPYKSVMLVAAGLDGNNGILPVAFCEVNVEDLESWVYFLKNINNALRLENGKGICILGDGDNGIDYAVEEFLPEAAYKQCCHKVFTEMVKRFPAAPVQHLFWSACRSTSEASFYKYMDLIQQQSKECHEWLLQTNWSSWALFSIPKWVKCTSVTLSITDKLHSRLRQYLEMSIARRFTGIARLTADLFERRRMAVWNWYIEKVTPTVREVINDRTIDGQRFAMVEQNGTTLKLTDTISMFYDLDMEAMSCSCGLWQISGIPCAHACRAIQLNMGNVEEYVDNMMSVQNYCSTYAPGMAQLPKEHDWKSDAGNIILPPMIHSPKVVSAKDSNEIVPNTSLQSIANYSHSATNNQQYTQQETVTRSVEQRDSMQMISTSSDGSISL